MHAWNHIGIGIGSINRFYHHHKDIIPLKGLRTQILSIGKQKVKYEAEGKPYDNAVHISLKFRDIFDQQINPHHKQKGIPHVIREDVYKRQGLWNHYTTGHPFII